MQATRDLTQSTTLAPNHKASRLPEYVYQAAILVAVLLILWTAA